MSTRFDVSDMSATAGAAAPAVPGWFRIGLRLLPVLVAVYWVSLLLHRSAQPTILGRYSVGFTIYLVVVAGAAALAGLGARHAAMVALWRMRFHLVVVVVMSLLSLIVLEGMTRTFMAVTRSPFYWLWGTRKANMMVQFNNDNRLTHEGLGYAKYPPNTVMHQGTYAHKLPVRINNLGFRGEDWTPEKPAGVFRVVCLGGSSTFGFTNPDGHTYPDYIERALNAEGASPSRRFQVLNLGIPHMNSARIQALFEHEVMAYDPDIVLVYEGANDTLVWPDPPGLGRTLKVLSVDVAKRVLFWSVLHNGLVPPRSIPLSELRAEGPARAAAYVARMEAIRDAAFAKGVPLLLVTQQLTALHDLGRAAELSRLSYADEVATFRREVEQQGGVRVGPVAQLLTHTHIMDAVRQLDGAPGITVVDGIPVLDRRRDLIRSWVHLSEEGNEMLAEAIAAAIRTLAAGRRES